MSRVKLRTSKKNPDWQDAVLVFKNIVSWCFTVLFLTHLGRKNLSELPCLISKVSTNSPWWFHAREDILRWTVRSTKSRFFSNPFLGMCGMCSTFTNAIRAIHNKFRSGRKHSSHKKAKPKASARAAQGEISRSPSWLKFDILSAKVRKKAKIHTMPRWDSSICLFNSKCTANHPTNLEAPRFLQEALKCVHEVDLTGWRDSPWQLDHLLKYPWQSFWKKLKLSQLSIASKLHSLFLSLDVCSRQCQTTYNKIPGSIFFSLTSQNLHFMISCKERGMQQNGSKIKMVQLREHETGGRAMEKDEHEMIPNMQK